MGVRTVSYYTYTRRGTSGMCNFPEWTSWQIYLADTFFVDQDVIAVPVSRENCSTSANYTETPSEVAALLPNPEGRLPLMPSRPCIPKLKS